MRRTSMISKQIHHPPDSWGTAAVGDNPALQKAAQPSARPMPTGLPSEAPTVGYAKTASQIP